jgi:hypothetical protein
MRRMRSPWTRAFLIWTAMFLVGMILLALDASAGLISADQACFVQTAPCPDASHPRVIELQFALLGMPLIWVVGLVVGVVGRAVAERRSAGSH